MVYTKHFCGICNKPYDSLNKAISCQSKGLMGCEIKPGLILKSNRRENSYHLFSSNFTEEHRRFYIDHNLEFNKRGKIISFRSEISIHNLSFNQVVSYLKNKTWSFMDKEELKEV